MRDYIERLRAKPEHVRRRIALGTSVGVTGVIAFFWAVALIFGNTLSIEPSGSAQGTLAANGSGTVNGVDSTEGGPGSNVAGVDFSGINANFAAVMNAIGIPLTKPAAPTLQVEDQAPPSIEATSGPTQISF